MEIAPTISVKRYCVVCRWPVFKTKSTNAKLSALIATVVKQRLKAASGEPSYPSVGPVPQQSLYLCHNSVRL